MSFVVTAGIAVSVRGHDSTVQDLDRDSVAALWAKHGDPDWPAPSPNGGLVFEYGGMTERMVTSARESGSVVYHHVVSDFACGWPLRSHAMVGRARAGNGPVQRDFGGCLELPPSLPVIGRGKRQYIPLAPLWGGLIGNALIYGTGIWAIVATVVWTRRAWRRRRGKCERCGYPASDGARCPECGSVARPAGVGMCIPP